MKIKTTKVIAGFYVVESSNEKYSIERYPRGWNIYKSGKLLVEEIKTKKIALEIVAGYLNQGVIIEPKPASNELASQPRNKGVDKVQKGVIIEPKPASNELAS